MQPVFQSQGPPVLAFNRKITKNNVFWEGSMKKHFLGVFMVGCMFLLLSFSAEDLAVLKVRPNIAVISGAGGNILVYTGKKESLVVDSGYKRSAGDVLKKVKVISPTAITYLLITHYHGDHTGGMAVVGKGAEIVCHENCLGSIMREKAAESERHRKPDIKTFRTGDEMTWNFRSVILIHPGPGHTAGDTIVVFPDDKVLHTGDLFFNGLPPYIDVRDGSDTGNWVKTIRSMAEKYPDYTVVPGHGPVSDMNGWKKFAGYLQSLRDIVQKGIQDGKSKKEILAAADLTPYKNLKEKGEFLTVQNNLGWIYDEMNRK